MCGLSLDFCADPEKPLKALRETADSEDVDARVRLLRQMVAESLYVVDERAVADAILARARVREAVAAPSLRGTRRPSPVRSFRRTRSARSFRLTSHPAAPALRR
jgi:hypothetical protein